MNLMRRALLLATLLLIGSTRTTSGQEASVLHLTAVVIDPGGKSTPVPRHALLISDEPPTAAPRRIFTALDGTANVRLRPGNYTVESDQPVVFYGMAYQWTQRIAIVSGRDTNLELTAGNAEVEVATATTAAAGTSTVPGAVANTVPLEADPLFVESQWRNSAVTIWTPTARGSGFLIDERGLIATNQRAIGSANSVEVQLSPTVKVAASVLAADPVRDVALLWIDPKVAALRPVSPGCAQAAMPPVVAAACEVLASAEASMKDAAPPAGTHLPVEPLRPFPVDALKDAVERRAGGLNPYQMSSSDFDIAFITPIHISGAQAQSEQQRGRASSVARPLFDFSNWSQYVADVPPVLLIRVTPKMVEGFWTTVGRFAARTQGVDLPPFKKVKSGFSRMRLLCGDAEVTPIHPFTIEQRVSEREAVDEGLYVFDPGALGPHCGTVKLELYSEKEPLKADTRAVEPGVVQQIWQDFAPHRVE